MQAQHLGALLSASSGSSCSIAAKCLDWRHRIHQCTATRRNSSSLSIHGQQQTHHLQCQAASAGLRHHTAAKATATGLTANTSSSTDSHSQQQQQSGIPAMGAEVTVVCGRLGTEGVGVCTAPPSRFVLLIKGALPGEQLVAKITAVKKGD